MNTNRLLLRILTASLLTGSATLIGCAGDAPNVSPGSTTVTRAATQNPALSPESDAHANPMWSLTGVDGEELVEMIVPAEVEIGDIGWATFEGVLATSAFATSWNLEAFVKWLPESLSAKEGIRADEIKALTKEVNERAAQVAFERAVRRLDSVNIAAQVEHSLSLVPTHVANRPTVEELTEMLVHREVRQFEIAKLRAKGITGAEAERKATASANYVAKRAAAMFEPYQYWNGMGYPQGKAILEGKPSSAVVDLKSAVRRLEIKVKEALQLVSKTSRAGADWLAQNANRMMGARIVLYGTSLTVGLMTLKDLNDVCNGISGVALVKRELQPKLIMH